MEPIAKLIETTVINDNTLFDIDNPLKELSVEELLTKCLHVIDGLKIYDYENDIKTIQELNAKNERIEKLKPLVVYLGELFRRNVLDLTMTYIPLDSNKNITYFIYLYSVLFKENCMSCKNKVSNDGYITNNNQCNLDLYGDKYGNIMCYSCYNKNKTTTHVRYKHNALITSSSFPLHQELMLSPLSLNKQLLDNRNISIYNELNRSIGFVYCYCKQKLKEIQMVKETMVKILKTPLLTKELETCMDEILDLNGNKISQLKDYLTEDQYRFVRSGAKFDELDGQQDMLNRMNKMLEELKRCAIGEAVLDVPLAQPIQYLKNEFTSYKLRQKEHENDLKKLITKI
jgi:hypothetical protein